MFTYPCTIALQFDQELMAIHNDPIYTLHGKFIRPHDGYTRNDCLAYVTKTKKDAIKLCKEIHPTFHVDYVTVCQ